MQGFARIIGVVSGKGGVGKTTAVANIGVSLAHDYKKKVLVIDGNVTTSNLGIHLGILYPQVTLHDVLEDKAQIEQAIYVHESGLHVIPASLSVKRRAYYERLKSKIAELTANYDIILIDGAAGIGNEVKAVMMASDELLIITNPEITAVTAAIKVSETAKDMDSKVLGIVVNKVRKKSYEISAKEIESSCESGVISVIPDDPAVQESISKRVPVLQCASGSRAAIEFRRLAASLIGETYVEAPFWQRVAIKLLKLVGVEATPVPATVPAKSAPPQEKVQQASSLLSVKAAAETVATASTAASTTVTTTPTTAEEEVVEGGMAVREESIVVGGGGVNKDEMKTVREEGKKDGTTIPSEEPLQMSSSSIHETAGIGHREDARAKMETAEMMPKRARERPAPARKEVLELQKSLVKIKKLLTTLDYEYKHGFLSKENYDELKAGNEKMLEELEKEMAALNRIEKGAGVGEVRSPKEEENPAPRPETDGDASE